MRAIAMIALAYLLALSPVLSSKIQSFPRGRAGANRFERMEHHLLGGWSRHGSRQ